MRIALAFALIGGAIVWAYTAGQDRAKSQSDKARIETIQNTIERNDDVEGASSDCVADLIDGLRSDCND